MTFHNIKDGKFPMPGTTVFIRLDEKATRKHAYPEAYVVSVETWCDGHIHFIEAAGEHKLEFLPQYIKDWCYLMDLL